MTENGALCIVGNARHPNLPGVPAAVAPLVAGLRQLPGHVFWPDNVSLLDAERIDATRLLSSGQVTGTYLPALACAHDGQLASVDRRLVLSAVVRKGCI